MHSKYNKYLKTLGPRAAKLIATLYSGHRPIFHFEEAAKILGGRNPASKVLSQLIKHGVVNRLLPGTFCIVPFELGFERKYFGNPYVIARELLTSGQERENKKYYISYGSAFDLHQMVTQPQLVVYISSPKMIRSRVIEGTEFRFIRCKVSELFGLKEIWVDKTEKIWASDLERTLLDGLKTPVYCGGFSEVAKAFSIKHQEINPQKLIDYAIRLDVGAVTRRLGFLMELYQIGFSEQWEVLQKKLTSTYQLLDPELPSEGRYILKWRLKLNISKEELLAIKGT